MMMRTTAWAWCGTALVKEQIVMGGCCSSSKVWMMMGSRMMVILIKVTGGLVTWLCGISSRIPTCATAAATTTTATATTCCTTFATWFQSTSAAISIPSSVSTRKGEQATGGRFHIDIYPATPTTIHILMSWCRRYCLRRGVLWWSGREGEYRVVRMMGRMMVTRCRWGRIWTGTSTWLWGRCLMRRWRCGDEGAWSCGVQVMRPARVFVIYAGWWGSCREPGMVQWRGMMKVRATYLMRVGTRMGSSGATAHWASPLRHSLH